jgi:hypothetical protein
MEGEAIHTGPSNSYLSEPEFKNLIESQLERKFETEEINFVSRFFLTHCPLRTNAVSTALSQYVAAKGKSLHLRSYLDHIRISIFKNRR